MLYAIFKKEKLFINYGVEKLIIKIYVLMLKILESKFVIRFKLVEIAIFFLINFQFYLIILVNQTQELKINQRFLL